MATRKSSDGSRSADVGSERPGSYAKVSGSRRRRKGRRGSTSPPPDLASAVVASPGLEAAAVVDTVGEESDDGRISDLGDVAVDDLRRPSKPSSNRAPRKEMGPLGLEDIRSDPPANTVVEGERPQRTPSDPARVNVVEINSSPSRSERRSLFDEDEDADAEDFERDTSTYGSLPERSDQELARDYDLDASSIGSDIRASMRPARTALARIDDPYDSQDATHSLSSVLGARPSLRPSPPPVKQRDAASILWWLVVSGLTAIIAAAVTIAAREQLHQQEPGVAPVAKVAPAPPAPPPKVEPPPVSFGTPQTMIKAEPAKPPPPREPRSAATASTAAPVPAASSAAVRPGAPGTSVVTGAAAVARPVVTASPAASAAKHGSAQKAIVPPKPNVAPAAEAERPVGDSNYAPGYGKQINPATSYAPGYGGSKPALTPAPDAERGKPKLVPMRETTETELPGLPVNPYE